MEPHARVLDGGRLGVRRLSELLRGAASLDVLSRRSVWAWYG